MKRPLHLPFLSNLATYSRNDHLYLAGIRSRKCLKSEMVSTLLFGQGKLPQCHCWRDLHLAPTRNANAVLGRDPGYVFLMLQSDQTLVDSRCLQTMFAQTTHKNFLFRYYLFPQNSFLRTTSSHRHSSEDRPRLLPLQLAS